MSYDSPALEEESTKMGTTRAVPVHAELAKVLAAWKLSHWERINGRAPGADHHIGELVAVVSVRPLPGLVRLAEAR